MSMHSIAVVAVVSGNGTRLLICQQLNKKLNGKKNEKKNLTTEIAFDLYNKLIASKIKSIFKYNNVHVRT